MKIGILGTGFGAYHGKIYKKLEHVEGITIWGRNAEKLEKIKKEVGIEVASSIDAILNDKTIDLIDICLPSHLHKDYVIKALKKGKDVFCETPIALSIEDCIAMREAEKRYGKRVFVNLFIKNEYPYRLIYDIIEKKTLGSLKALHVRRKTPPLWGDLGLNRIAANLMIHDFDFIIWLLGMPEKISSTGISGNEGQSHLNALLTYKDTIVEVHGSSLMPHSHPFTVGYEAVFQEGTIEYFEHGYEDSCERSLVMFTNDKKEILEIKDEDCYEKTLTEVINGCTSNNPPEKLGLEEAMKALRLALLVEGKNSSV